MNLRTAILVASLLSAVPASALPIIGNGNPLDYLALNGGSQVTFDDVDPKGDYSDLTLGSVRFTSEPSFTITNYYNGAYNTSGGAHLTNFEDMVPGVFRFDFLHGTKAFAFNFGASGLVWLVAGYNSKGALIDSYSIAPIHDSDQGEYYGLMSDVEFHFATLTVLTDSVSDEVLIDNFTIAAASSVSPVPIPASLPLLIAAVGALGLVRRKVSQPNA